MVIQWFFTNLLYQQDNKYIQMIGRQQVEIQFH